MSIASDSTDPSEGILDFGGASFRSEARRNVWFDVRIDARRSDGGATDARGIGAALLLLPLLLLVSVVADVGRGADGIPVGGAGGAGGAGAGGAVVGGAGGVGTLVAGAAVAEDDESVKDVVDVGADSSLSPGR